MFITLLRSVLSNPNNDDFYPYANCQQQQLNLSFLSFLESSLFSFYHLLFKLPCALPLVLHQFLSVFLLSHVSFLPSPQPVLSSCIFIAGYTVVPNACSSVTHVVAFRETATLIESVCDLCFFKGNSWICNAVWLLRVLLRKFSDTRRSKCSYNHHTQCVAFRVLLDT